MIEHEKRYNRLMKLLRQLKREDAEFIQWVPKYEKDADGEPNGFMTITISIKQKES
jgi:hypothetical protein